MDLRGPRSWTSNHFCHLSCVNATLPNACPQCSETNSKIVLSQPLLYSAMSFVNARMAGHKTVQPVCKSLPQVLAEAADMYDAALLKRPQEPHIRALLSHLHTQNITSEQVAGAIFAIVKKRLGQLHSLRLLFDVMLKSHPSVLILCLHEIDGSGEIDPRDKFLMAWNAPDPCDLHRLPQFSEEMRLAYFESVYSVHLQNLLLHSANRLLASYAAVLRQNNFFCVPNGVLPALVHRFLVFVVLKNADFSQTLAMLPLNWNAVAGVCWKRIVGQLCHMNAVAQARGFLVFVVSKLALGRSQISLIFDHYGPLLSNEAVMPMLAGIPVLDIAAMLKLSLLTGHKPDFADLLLRNVFSDAVAIKFMVRAFEESTFSTELQDKLIRHIQKAGPKVTEEFYLEFFAAEVFCLVEKMAAAHPRTNFHVLFESGLGDAAPVSTLTLLLKSFQHAPPPLTMAIDQEVKAHLTKQKFSVFLSGVFDASSCLFVLQPLLFAAMGRDRVEVLLSVCEKHELDAEKASIQSYLLSFQQSH